MDWLLTSIQATIPWPMSWQWPSWMLPVTARWPIWPITTFSCIIGHGTPISMWMPCWVSWPGYMPDTTDTHIQITVAAVWTIQKASLKGSMSLIEAYSNDPSILDAVEDGSQITCINIDDWHQAQHADPVLSLVITRLQNGILSQCQLKTTDPPEVPQFLRECNHLKLRWGILYRKILLKESQESLFQLVLLAAYRETALKGCHDEVGHLGLECMLDLMCDYFLWSGMAPQAKEHIEQCHMCLTFKAKQPRAPLQNIVATHPLELVHLDSLCLEPGNVKKENLLVMMDHFTQYAQAYVTWSQTALMTAKALWAKLIVHYGLPKKVLSDQGRNFESELITDLCSLMGTLKLQTSLYHLQTNSQCERFNSTLIGMLGTLSLEWNQTGRVALGHWSMPIPVPGILPHVSVCIFLWMEGNPTFQLMSP